MFKKTKNVANATGDNNDALNANKRNHQCKYIAKLKKNQQNYLDFMRKKQIESFEMLAKSLAECTICEIELKIGELNYLPVEDKHLITRMVFNEISKKIETIHMQGVEAICQTYMK